MPYDLDPELAAVVPLFPNFGLDTPEQVDAARDGLARLLAAAASPVDTSGLMVDDLDLPGVVDEGTVRVRCYRPEEPALAPAPALLYLHGGGFVMGSIETEHPAAADLARSLAVPVVSVDYRLAPEHPFPAALEDCYAALAWLAGAAPTLGVDPDRIAVLGRSAGAGLAAGLTLLARDRGGPAICFQYLDIPELDDRLGTPSMRAFVDTPMWNRSSAEASWRHYLGADLADRTDTSPYASPARATDLSGLPPAHVTTMEFDPLRDEGIEYALALLRAGVSVELHQYPRTFHGSIVAVGAAVSRRNRADEHAALRRALEVP